MGSGDIETRRRGEGETLRFGPATHTTTAAVFLLGRPWFIVIGMLITFILSLAGRTAAGMVERLARVERDVETSFVIWRLERI